MPLVSDPEESFEHSLLFWTGTRPGPANWHMRALGQKETTYPELAVHHLASGLLTPPCSVP